MDRKEIIKALEQRFGVKAKYMGPPRFEYQIEIGGEIFTIHKDGKITSPTGSEIEFERLINDDTKETECVNEIIHPEVGIPMDGHTGATLRNLLNMIYSKQVLIKKVFEQEDDIVSKEFINAINGIDIKTIEDFKSALISKGEENLPGIEFDFDTYTITFKFCNYLLEPEKLVAYAHFVTMLSKSAKELKHASFKTSDTDNDKFTMRAWLIRLGFIGQKYKASRKILLKNLEGNSAFRRPNFS